MSDKREMELRGHRAQDELTRLNAEVAGLKLKLGFATAAFWELRAAWFDKTLHQYAHPREWEDVDAERSRKEHNKTGRKRFDMDTDAILAGKPLVIAPSCIADLRKKPEATDA